MKSNYLILYRDVDWGAVGSGAGTGALGGAALGPWGAAAGAVIGGVSALIGSGQKNKASKLFNDNKYPIQGVPEAQRYNEQLARQMANEGLPSQQYAYAMKNIQRQQATALRNAADRRAGIGLIGQIQQGTDDATAKLDAQNAEARLNNKRALLGVNSRTAAYQQSAFDWNQKNKYNQNYNYAMQLQGAGNANIIHGIDSIGAALVNYGGKGFFGSGKKSNPYSGTLSDPNVGGGF